MSETKIMREIQVAASTRGARLFRNQTGKYKLEDGRWLSSGLCIGSPDLVGWTSVIITPEMVGKNVAVFTGIEVKDGFAEPTKEQESFIVALQKAGGIGFLARSEAEAVDFLAGGSNG